MSSSPLSSIFSQLGEAFGLPELAPDENGFCTVQVDDKFTLNFMVSDNQESLTLFSQLGYVDPESQPELVVEILSANLFWNGTNGATLGMEPRNGAVVAMRQFEAGTLTYPALESALEGFINTCERWFEKISEDEGLTADSDDEAFIDSLVPGIRA